MKHEQGTEFISLEKVKPSSTNQRKSADKAKDAELAESVRSSGILQPILVRPVNGHFEIVAGERRYRAAKAAGLVQIPALVRPMDDAAAQEAQAVENLQREDLSPAEEARGFLKLVENFKATPETLSQKLGKSRAYIAQRLSLAKADKSVLEALEKGKITLGAAIAVSRVPRAADQAKILTGAIRNGAGDVATAEDVQSEVYLFNRDLSKAPFDLKDEILLKEAGSCMSCPKRSGNQADLFGSDKDTCLDAVCFVKKANASWENLTKKFDAEGARVLSDGTVRAAEQQYPSPYVKLQEVCYDDPSHRRWGNLLSPFLKAKKIRLVVARGLDLKPYEMVPRVEAYKLLRDEGILRSKAAPSGKVSDDEKRRRALEKKKQEKIDLEIAVAVAHVEKSGLSLAGARAVAENMINTAGSSVNRTLSKRLGLKPSTGLEANEMNCKAVNDMSSSMCFGVIGEILLRKAAEPYKDQHEYRELLAGLKKK